MKKEIEFWEVEIKCIVKKTDCNGRSVSKKRVEDDLQINFDQLDFEDVKIKVTS